MFIFLKLFQVVYEDGDFEDLSTEEVRGMLWDGMMPTKRMAECLRHSAQLAELE